MRKLFIICIILFSTALQGCKSQISLDKLKSEGTKILNQGTGSKLTNDEIIKGLKEALTIGSNNASSLVSRVDGYYKNPQLYIPFPPEAKKVQETLIKYGQNKLVNDFVMTLNRAAEEAAKEAAPIFVSAVKNMTIKDGLNILNGSNDAATSYLKSNTQAELLKKFRPVIERALSKVNATKYWSTVMDTYNKIPGVQKMNPDLAGYATQKAIDGLFVMVAKEELKIRQDPAARVTDILKKVFGK